jgi:hypothetical protein
MHKISWQQGHQLQRKGQGQRGKSSKTRRKKLCKAKRKEITKRMMKINQQRH